MTLAVALLIVVAMGAGFGIGHLAWQSGSTGSQPSTTSPSSGSAPSRSAREAPRSVQARRARTRRPRAGRRTRSAIASGVDPALADVNTTLGYDAEEAAGTGIVLTSTGEVLTNNHVIDGATSISVTDVGNGRVYQAAVVGYDRSGDVAILQLQGASGLKVASLGTRPRFVWARRSSASATPAGWGTPSVAGGSVTALDQSITATEQDGGNPENLTGLIEVNSDIQPGDSGGPLVNTAGRVLGMDTAASAGFSFQTSGTQGYAIPINTAVSIADRIESGQTSGRSAHRVHGLPRRQGDSHRQRIARGTGVRGGAEHAGLLGRTGGR